MGDLSGGQRKLAVLASCLARRPDVLLLDEPEAHLDAVRRERLEAIIRTFDGAVVVVSHDRYLLDETVEEIAELEDGRITLVARQLLGVCAGARAHAQTPAATLRRPAEGDSAPRRGDPALPALGQHHRERTTHPQASNKQRQIERMDKVERPVLERRKIGLELPREGSGAAGR